MNILEFFASVCIGIVTQSIVNDYAAVAACRKDLLELETAVNRLIKCQAIVQRVDDAQIIEEINDIVWRFEAHCAGLSIKIKRVLFLVNRTKELYLRRKNFPNESQNAINFIGVDLREIWTNDGLQNLKRVLYSNLTRRCIFRFKETVLFCKQCKMHKFKESRFV